MDLQIAGLAYQSEVNGPGVRAVIWLQGCPKRCKGCWNPDFLKFGLGERRSPSDVFEEVRSRTAGFEAIQGVTFSGGEPFSQSTGLVKLSHMFKDYGLSLMAFSGYTISELRSLNSSTSELMRMLDILVDGEYDSAQACNRLWRSSLNQTVHFLSDRHAQFKAETEIDQREYEITIESDEVKMTGFPVPSVLNSMKN